jgi:hypothetical protein
MFLTTAEATWIGGVFGGLSAWLVLIATEGRSARSVARGVDHHERRDCPVARHY